MRHYDVVDSKDKTLIVLGKGLTRLGELTIESKMNAIAGGWLFSRGLAKSLIITGGRTLGPDFDSEAQKMYDWGCQTVDVFERGVPGVYLDHGAIDTYENADRTKEIAERESFDKFGLISIGSHLPRAKEIFERKGIKIESCFPSEEVLRDIFYETHSTNYSQSSHNSEKLKELILRGIDSFDLGENFLNWIAHRTRG
jgi:hypothetical protein